MAVPIYHPHLRQWSGDSRSQWEGDTLVVETTNFLRETALDGSSAKMHLVERFTRLDTPRCLCIRVYCDRPGDLGAVVDGAARNDAYGPTPL